MNSENFEPPEYEPDTLLHLCRHFSRLSEFDKKMLYDLGYSDEEIEKELRLQGSKFYDPPFDGINSLLNYIKQNWNIKKQLQEKDDVYSFNFKFDKSNFYEDGIGNDGLVKISDLQESEKLRITVKDRKGISVNTYPSKNKIPAHEIVLIAKNFNNQLKCITIYPGTYAPPFPIPSMETEFFDICKNFWANHALVEFIN